MGNGNRPTPEFRREAVRLALTSGRTRREIAEDLGLGLSTLPRWLGQERDAGEPGEAPVALHGPAEASAAGECGSEAFEPDQETVQWTVCPANGDILKAAAAFFARGGNR